MRNTIELYHVLPSPMTCNICTYSVSPIANNKQQQIILRQHVKNDSC